MGCVCAKEAYILDYPDTPKSSRGPGSNGFSIRWLTGSRSTKEERHLHNENSYLGNVSKLKRKGSHPVGSIQIDTQKRAERFRADSDLNVLLSNPPNHTQAEQVAAGWPAWLAAVAGEAIKGWIPRKADSFEKLIKIGQGTYSNVYKARDLDSGKIVALKKVRFDNFEPESVRFMAREIQVLRRLDHPNVVKLEGLVTSGVSCNLYLVFEYMEHDLAGLAACPGIKFTEPQVKCYMQQLLCGLDHCHSRGVLHRDIKGSNLLIDNGGILKIADFGLANFFHPDQKQLLTSRVVTLWYRPPELLLGATDYGVAVDLWSTGCILAELLYGKPIMPGRTEVEQLHKIFKLCGSPSEEYWQNSKLPHATIFKPQQPYRRCVTETFKDFPLSALTLLETLLAIEPGNRGVAAGALKSEFFATKPLPCDPASLPKYPPSKELDAKIHAEEARRQGNARGMGRGSEAAKGASRESRAGPQADASAELAPSIQKLGPSSHGASNIMNEKFNPQLEDDTVGFCVNPPRPVHSFFEVTGVSLAHTLLPGPARSGPMSYPDISHSKIQKKQKDEGVQIFSGQPSKSLTVSDFKTQGISGRQHAAELLNFSRLETGRNYDGAGTHKDWSSLPQLNQVECVEKGKSEFSGVPDFSAKQNNTQLQGPESLHRLEGFHLRDMPRENHWRDERPASREPLVGSCDQERIHYSGPLLPSYENIDDILEKHERHIQRAVRRARQGRGEASRNYSSHSGTKVFENKGGVSTAKGNTDSSKLKGGLTTSISGIQQKVNKSCVTEQIVDGRKYEGKPLSSIMGNFQREQES